MLQELPTVEQAQQAIQYLAAQYGVPVLRNKLASVYGIEPKTEEELMQLIELGAMLESQHALYQEKVASSGQRNAFLDYLLEKIGGQLPQQVSEDEVIEKIASQLVQDDPIAVTAANVFHHLINGGEVAPDSQE